MNNRKTRVRTLRISHELDEQIKNMAERENRNFNNMVITILFNAVNHEKHA